jgi:hypothetical protein
MIEVRVGRHHGVQPFHSEGREVGGHLLRFRPAVHEELYASG